ncbi:hypothetical protein [Pseudobutyrivibrio sp.]|uniref:hypothetical protein n=1 Tax=Pseudobutyrivibrio sp. TaxID=2014367 RepID=UPI001B429518|nr:hypothetical protein [Pseudobutyrivibrio sp.]MBP3261404.1 hypothetical protein [Pseudobutyrivibrio sp.]
MIPFVDKMSVSDSLLNVSKSVLNYATIIKPLAEEWWHFTLKNEPYKDTSFTFPVTTKSVVSSANTTSSTASTTMLGNSPDWIAKL